MYGVCVACWWFVFLVWYMYFLFGSCECNFVLCNARVNMLSWHPVVCTIILLPIPVVVVSQHNGNARPASL